MRSCTHASQLIDICVYQISHLFASKIYISIHHPFLYMAACSHDTEGIKYSTKLFGILIAEGNGEIHVV